MYLVMAVRSCRFTGASNIPDDLASFDTLSNLGLYPEHMAVQGFVPISMVNHDMITIPGTEMSGNLHHTIGRSVDRCSLGRGKIKTRMKLHSLIHRVNPVTKAGSNALEVFIA